MAKEWIAGSEGRNLKFKHETLLNYAMNRWGLNKAHSVGKTSELIRACAPSEKKEWEEFYFSNAKQKKEKWYKCYEAIYYWPWSNALYKIIRSSSE